MTHSLMARAGTAAKKYTRKLGEYGGALYNAIELYNTELVAGREPNKAVLADPCGVRPSTFKNQLNGTCWKTKLNTEKKQPVRGQGPYLASVGLGY